MEPGRVSTLLLIAAFRKARVVGLAYTRRCPQFLTLGKKPNDGENLNSGSEALLVASGAASFSYPRGIAVVRLPLPVKDWEIIADNLKKRG